MTLRGMMRKVTASQGLLLGWVLLCAAWAVAAPKPWQTHAFDPGRVKQVALREYIAAGLWIGLVISGGLAVALLLLQRWWGRPEAAPVAPAGPGRGQMPLRWFALAVLGILTFALWQRWPAMSLSFWGDEGWMFCDFVHGKWQPAMYSWKGGVYGLVFANIVIAGRLLWGPMPQVSLRRVAVVRWLSAGLLGAMLFIPLAMPSQLQMRKSIEEVRRRAKPMESEWRHNILAETLTGIPWVEQETANPREISLERLARQSWWTWPAVVAMGGIFLVGLWRLWRQDRFLAWLCVAVLASGVAAAVHFKYSLRVELLTWYLLYNLPVLALLFATAVTPRPGPAPLPGRPAGRRLIGWSLAGASALTGFAVLGAPMAGDFQSHPRENLKRAWEITRAVHEPAGFRGPSNIFTGWLWRHTFAYEPRGDMYVRTREALEARRDLARRTHGEFYMIVGIRSLSNMICPDVMQALQDPAQFDHLATLWGVEPLNTLEVYRMRKDPPKEGCPADD